MSLRERESTAVSGERHYEIENRIRNLIWTVSGDYGLNDTVDIRAFKISKYIALYDAIWRGAFAKHFDRDALLLYCAKKAHLGAAEADLTAVVQMCAESAVYPKLASERAGVSAIRMKAFDDMLELVYDRLASTPYGRIRLGLIKYCLTEENIAEKRIAEPVDLIVSLSENAGIQEIIETIDAVYNNYVDLDFEKHHGTLAQVLAITLEDLKEFEGDWFNDELYGELPDNTTDTISDAAFDVSYFDKAEKTRADGGASAIILDDAALARMNAYVEINYGKSYLSERDRTKITRATCTGMHENCSVHFTDGILHAKGSGDYQRKRAILQHEKNKMMYYDNHRVVKHNISILTDIIKKAFVIHQQADKRVSDSGILASEKLWRVGRTDTRGLFYTKDESRSIDFVVDILIDASGSQKSRQGKVALQSYIISEALSNLGIPHRVLSFNTFWDYTIMRRFRDYEDDRSANARIFEYTTSANNRDGLAVRAAVDGLFQRKEEKKVLIILSDGKPNDVNLNRPGSRNPAIYTGEEAIKDTAHEIRAARLKDICVLGVFAGKEHDLGAEKVIFGKDFAYIRDIANFSYLVGMYLKKQIENI